MIKNKTYLLLILFLCSPIIVFASSFEHMAQCVSEQITQGSETSPDIVQYSNCKNDNGSHFDTLIIYSLDAGKDITPDVTDTTTTLVCKLTLSNFERSTSITPEKAESCKQTDEVGIASLGIYKIGNK